MQKQAFDELVRQCHADVYRTALLVSGEAETAADVAQEVYLDLLAGRIALAEAARPCAVLRWFAARGALAARRAGRRRRQKESDMTRTEKTQDPADLVSRDEGRQLLWEEVMRLPEELRQPLVLRYREGATLARVGETLGIPLQTASDRIKRACDRLRPRLAGAGLGAAALPDLLAGNPGFVVPSGLEASLLGLVKTTGALLVLKVAVVALVVAAGGYALVEFGDREPDRLDAGGASTLVATEEADRVPGRPHRADSAAMPLPTPEVISPAEEADGVDPSALTPAAVDDEVVSALQDEDHGRLRGRALDQDDRPLPNVLVTASSVEHVGKMPRFAETARSGADGRFELTLPLGEKETRSYRLRLRLEDHSPVTIAPIEIEAGRLRDTGDHRLRARSPSDRSFVDLVVLDPEGAPASGIVAELMRLREREDAEAWPDPGTVGLTDAAGRLEIPVTRAGAHRLRVDGSRSGFGVELRDIEIPEGGRVTCRVALDRGGAISVLAADVDGGEARGLSLRLRDLRDPNHWIGMRREGALFRAEGLGRGPYELWNDDGWWSAFRIPGLVPGDAPLEVVVKRREDRRDRGRHEAEIHLGARLAADGSPVAIGPFEADLHRVQDRPDAEILRDHAPWLVPDGMQQRALVEPEDVGLPPVPGCAGVRVFDGLEPGVYLAVLRVRGFAPKLVGPIRLGEREIAVLDPVLLAPPRPIAGRIVDAEGRPLAGALVVPGGEGPHSRAECLRIAALLDEQRLSQRILVPGAALSDAEGRFQVTAVDPGLETRLRALHPEAGRAVVVVPPGAVPAEVRMNMQR